jgi:hypothetical protein
MRKRVFGKSLVLLFCSMLLIGFGSTQLMAGKWCIVLNPDGPIPSYTPSEPNADWNWGDLTIPEDLPPGERIFGPWRCYGGITNKGTYNLGVTGMEIDLDYFLSGVGGGCFENPNGESDPDGINVGYTGTFTVSKKKKDATPNASFWFWAEDNTASGEIHYYFNFSNAQFVTGPTDNTLDTYGNPVDTCDVDNWLPDVGCVTYVQFSDWELKFEGSGKDKKRACQGDGSFSSPGTVAIYRMYE